MATRPSRPKPQPWAPFSSGGVNDMWGKFWEHCVFASVWARPVYGKGGRFVDHLFSQNGASLKGSRYGNDWDFVNASNHHANAGDYRIVAIDPDTEPNSFFVFFRPTTASGNDSFYGSCQANGSEGDYAGYFLAKTSGEGISVSTGDGGPGTGTGQRRTVRGVDNTITIGAWNTAAITMTGQQSAIFFINGKSEGTGSTSGTGDALQNNDFPPDLGGEGDLDGQIACMYHLANYTWTIEEVRVLDLDPFAPFRRKRRVVGKASAAAADQEPSLIGGKLVGEGILGRHLVHA